MNQDDLLKLAQKIYALKVVINPDWDLQKHARESLNMAMQFALAVQAEQVQGSSPSEAPAQNLTHPASPMQMAQPEMSSSIGAPLPPDSTSHHTAEGTSAPAPTAGAVKFQRREPTAGTGLSQSQTQEQGATPERHVQVANPYPPIGR